LVLECLLKSENYHYRQHIKVRNCAPIPMSLAVELHVEVQVPAK
jgi:hypothetical protein